MYVCVWCVCDVMCDEQIIIIYLYLYVCIHIYNYAYMHVCTYMYVGSAVSQAD